MNGQSKKKKKLKLNWKWLNIILNFYQLNVKTNKLVKIIKYIIIYCYSNNISIKICLKVLT
jgi:hypothetical protein